MIWDNCDIDVHKNSTKNCVRNAVCAQPGRSAEERQQDVRLAHPQSSQECATTEGERAVLVLIRPLLILKCKKELPNVRRDIEEKRLDALERPVIRTNTQTLMFRR